MYVWQMNDGRWHISLFSTNSQFKYEDILAIPEAHRLFDRGYETETAARQAEKQIRAALADRTSA